MTAVAAGRARPHETWVAYGYLSAVGFALYATGALTPYLRVDLGLGAAEAALHASALAAGLLSAGLLHDRVERWLGRRRAGVLAVVELAAGSLGLAFGPVLAVTVAAAFATGLGAGSMLASVNIVLGRSGGGAAEARLARANAWSLLAAMLAPLLIAVTAASPVGWRAVPILPLLATAVLEVGGGLPGAAASVEPTRDPAGSGPRVKGRAGLSRGFWTAWMFVAAVASIEFAYVVWGSTLVATRTGVSLETGTALATLFLAAMLAGRIALGLGRLGGYRSVPWVEIGITLSAAGGVVAWLAGQPLLSVVGLLVAGFGTATLYPQGIALALAHAPGDELAAGARLTLASGAAILSMPLVLGAIADAFGVVAGWPLVIGLAGLALVLRRISSATP